MSKTPRPTVVPDEPTDPPTPAPQGYTLADQIERNAQLIRELSDKYDIDPAALISLFTTTMNIHFTKLQLGLTNPIED